MSLQQSLAQLNASTRKFANAQGATALLRHPDVDVNDYVCRALGSLHRRLTEAQPDQRYLASTTITMVNGTSTYALPSDFDSLISVDLTAIGRKVWLVSYEMSERPLLTDPALPTTGVPFSYRLRMGNIEFLPTPHDAYVSTLWYLPDAPQLTVGQQFDTISRLDDYIVAYAARIIATKDKNWQLVAECRNVCGELGEEIAVIGRHRDQNAAPRIVDTYQSNRWGRRLWGTRRYR